MLVDGRANNPLDALIVRMVPVILTQESLQRDSYCCPMPAKPGDRPPSRRLYHTRRKTAMPPYRDDALQHVVGALAQVVRQMIASCCLHRDDAGQELAVGSFDPGSSPSKRARSRAQHRSCHRRADRAGGRLVELPSFSLMGSSACPLFALFRAGRHKTQLTRERGVSYLLFSTPGA